MVRFLRERARKRRRVGNVTGKTKERLASARKRRLKKLTK